MSARIASALYALVAFSCLLNTSPVGASIWTNAAGDGSWANPLNWDTHPVIPNGVDAVADFGRLDLAADATVNLNGNKTAGVLRFGDVVPSHNWEIASGSGNSVLGLDVGAGSPLVHVANPTQSPTPSVNSVNFYPSVVQSATISVRIAGNEGLVKTGAGTLVLTGPNIYTGTTAVRVGTLRLDFSAPNAATADILNRNSTLSLGGGAPGGSGGTLELVGATST